MPIKRVKRDKYARVQKRTSLAASMMEGLKVIGAVLIWGYRQEIDDYCLCVAYWKKAAKGKMPERVRLPKRLSYWSGYMSDTRGRHYTYKLKSGRCRS